MVSWLIEIYYKIMITTIGSTNIHLLKLIYYAFYLLIISLWELKDLGRSDLYCLWFFKTRKFPEQKLAQS